MLFAALEIIVACLLVRGVFRVSAAVVEVRSAYMKALAFMIGVTIILLVWYCSRTWFF
jgi:hypothetical protein